LPPFCPCGGVTGGVFPVPVVPQPEPPDTLPPPPEPPGLPLVVLPPAPPPADVIVDDPVKTEFEPFVLFAQVELVDPFPPPPTVTG
jgi:hypothetical protein